ncbi:translation initiation factor IF-2 associated domain-containing protein, partial [Methylicorpusculum sp.]|uniref:translation initiation factor IF-2 associated domain-containing protein n=1 Tax=Methylicorpusculum sp. TaxID=2713644 RepID=UPI002ABB68FC
MSNKTVQQLAEIVKIPLEKLLEQLKEAGLSATAPDDVINEDEKMQLLAHLRKRHGKDDEASENSPRRVTLKRRSVTELKQASAPGSGTKTISIEVRKQKTYIKREVEADESNTTSAAKSVVNEEISKQVEENIPVIESHGTPGTVSAVIAESEQLVLSQENT